MHLCCIVVYLLISEFPQRNIMSQAFHKCRCSDFHHVWHAGCAHKSDISADRITLGVRQTLNR